jgi:hypothetical protein
MLKSFTMQIARAGATGLVLMASASFLLSGGCVMEGDEAMEEFVDDTSNLSDKHCILAADVDAEMVYELDASGVERLVEVIPATDKDGDRPVKEADDITCFDTFADSIYYVSDGAIELPADATPGEYLDEIEEATRKSGQSFKSTIVSIDYKNSSYGGSSLTWTGSDPGCNQYSCGFLGLSKCRKSHSASSMPSGWNDVVSSSKAFSGCDNNVLYEHNDFGGANSGDTCHPNCSSVGGAMDDRASSRKWYH